MDLKELFMKKTKISELLNLGEPGDNDFFDWYAAKRFLNILNKTLKIISAIDI